jgi:hypothetical protein
MQVFLKITPVGEQVHNSESHAEFHVALKAQQKNVAKAYLLLVLLGVFGAHYRYVQSERPSLLYICLSMPTLVCYGLGGLGAVLMHVPGMDMIAALVNMGCFLLLGPSCILGMILALVLVYDAITLPSDVRKTNMRIEQDLSRKMS